MSPNQIRRLVLCSGHFQLGQLFNNGNGPCDAIPTIYNHNDENEVINCDQVETEDSNGNKLRPSVSSKKPKTNAENKPAPLAKKRGKSKRPTTINLPKIEKNENFVVKKVQIPTVNNWKLLSNQYQPITIQSNNIMNNVTGGIKKVILPLPGNISNLGAPIPVDSLSCMPPGLLIKINLPEQDNTVSGQEKVKNKKKGRRKVVKSEISNDFEFVSIHENIKNEIENRSQEDLSELLQYQDDCSQQFTNDELIVHTEEVFDDKYGESEMDITKKYVGKVEEDMSVEDIPKLKMTARSRRTLIPIRNELRHFIRKIKPQVHRLPKKSQAKVKLAIVNMVIEGL